MSEPPATGPRQRGEPDAAFRRADALVDLRRPEEAVTLLRQALTVHPEQSDLWGQLAMALLAADRPGEAREAAETRIRLAPEDEWGYRLASLALSELGEHAQATRAAAEAVRLAPSEWRTQSRLARAFAEEGQLKQAWPAALKTVELAPNEPEAHMTVGSVAMSIEDWRQAEMAYRHVLALDPANAAARNNLALVTLRRGELTGAAAGFADAVATDPLVDVARHNLEVTLRTVAGRLLLGQFAIAFVARGVLGRPSTARVGSVLVVAALAVVAGFGRRRWRAMPAPVRAYARSLPRHRRRYQLLLGLAVAGTGALLTAAGLAAGGVVGPARALAYASLGLTALASLVALRFQRR